VIYKQSLFITLLLIVHFTFGIGINETIPSPRGNALADSGIAAVTGIEALKYNPANLYEVQNKKSIDIGVYYRNQPELSSSSEYIVAKFQARKIIATALGMSYYNGGEYTYINSENITYKDGIFGSDTTAVIQGFGAIMGLSMNLPFHLSFGINLAYELINTGKRNQSDFYTDIGVTYNLKNSIKKIKKNWMGAVVPNRISAIYKIRNIIPSQAGKISDNFGYGLGINWVIPVKEDISRTFYTFNYVYSELFQLGIGIGQDFTIKKMSFGFMGGYKINKDVPFNFAVGGFLTIPIKNLGLKVSYGYRKDGYLGNTHEAGLVLQI